MVITSTTDRIFERVKELDALAGSLSYFFLAYHLILQSHS